MAQRWDKIRGEDVVSPVRVERFLDAIEKACRESGLSISHEDGHGAFVVENFSEHNVSWLRGAHMRIKKR